MTERVPQKDPWKDGERRERQHRRDRRVVVIAFAIGGAFLVFLAFATIFSSDGDAQTRTGTSATGVRIAFDGRTATLRAARACGSARRPTFCLVEEGKSGGDIAVAVMRAG